MNKIGFGLRMVLYKKYGSYTIMAPYFQLRYLSRKPE